MCALDDKGKVSVMKLTSTILLISVSLLTLSAQAQEKMLAGQFVLEEEEVILFDEMGKEIERRNVSKTGTEKAAIRKVVDEKALKTIGLKSTSEIKGKQGLHKKYLKARLKFIKVKALGYPTLKFVDGKKQVSREVSICPPDSECDSVVVTTTSMESWRGAGFDLTQADAETRKVKRRVSREPVVSKSRNAALIAELITESVVPVSTKEAALFERGGGGLGVTSGVEYYDDSGNMRWKKTAERGFVAYPASLSENGATVAVVNRCESECRKFINAGRPLQELAVYDSLGKEVLVLPLSKSACFSYNGGFWLSLDGMYMKVDCAPERGLPKSIFVNIKERKMWQAPYLVGIGRGDDGYEIRDGDKIKVVVTNPSMKTDSQLLDLGNVSWQKLP